MLKILRIYFISWTTTIPFRKKYKNLGIVSIPDLCTLTYFHSLTGGLGHFRICNQANSVHSLISSELYLG